MDEIVAPSGSGGGGGGLGQSEKSRVNNYVSLFRINSPSSEETRKGQGLKST